MAFQSVPETAQVNIVGSLDGQNCINTFYFTHDSGWGLTELQELADAIDSVVGSNMLPIMATSYDYLRTEARDLRTAIATLATSEVNAGPGSKTGTLIPNNAAISVKRSSGLTGRGARGRIYFPVTTNGNLSAPNLISSTFHDALLGLLDSFTTIAEGVDWAAVIVSRTGPGTSSTVAVVYTLVEWVIVNYVVDSMRRRLPGRGA